MMSCFVYGAGITGRVAKLCLEGYHGYSVSGFIDDACAGKYIEGVPAVLLEEVGKDEAIIVASNLHAEAIQRKLKENGYSNVLLFYYEDRLLDTRKAKQKDVFDTEAVKEVIGYFDDAYSSSAYEMMIHQRQSARTMVCSTLDQYLMYGTPDDDDVIFDCGAASGDTVAKFLPYISRGTIYAFEPGDEAFAALSRKYATDSRIVPVKKGCFRYDGEIGFVDAGNSGSGYVHENAVLKIEVVSIDSFVRSEGISRLDWIKMDIEGAEFDALIGAEETIRRFKPKLAISIYHRPEDMIEIPRLVHRMCSGYRFRFGHHSIGNGESVLYADYLHDKEDTDGDI